jgi:hypothetical protein
VYYNYRYYNPELGRWLSRDLLGELGASMLEPQKFDADAIVWRAKAMLSYLTLLNLASKLEQGGAYDVALTVRRMANYLKKKSSQYNGFVGGNILDEILSYGFVYNNPLLYFDALGKQPKDKRWGLPDDFWDWYHRQVKQEGDPDLPKDEADELKDEWDRQGRPDGEGHRTVYDFKQIYMCPPLPAPNPQVQMTTTITLGVVLLFVLMIMFIPIGI